MAFANKITLLPSPQAVFQQPWLDEIHRISSGERGCGKFRNSRKKQTNQSEDGGLPAKQLLPCDACQDDTRSLGSRQPPAALVSGKEFRAGREAEAQRTSVSRSVTISHPIYPGINISTTSRSARGGYFANYRAPLQYRPVGSKQTTRGSPFSPVVRTLPRERGSKTSRAKERLGVAAEVQCFGEPLRRGATSAAPECGSPSGSSAVHAGGEFHHAVYKKFV